MRVGKAIALSVRREINGSIGIPSPGHLRPDPIPRNPRKSAAIPPVSRNRLKPNLTRIWAPIDPLISRRTLRQLFEITLPVAAAPVLGKVISTSLLSIAFSVTSVGYGTATAQEPRDSSQDKVLGRIFQTQSRDVVPPDIERLESELKDLASDPLIKKIASAEIELARHALDNAIAAQRERRLSEAERAQLLVETALLLASRKAALERTRTALRVTKRKAAEAEKAAKRAEDELEIALRKRASLYLRQTK